MIKIRRGIWKLPGQAVSNCSSNFHHAFWETKNKRFFDETRFLILDSCRGGPYYLASGLKATIHLPCHAGDETLQTPPLVNMLHSMQLANEDLSYYFHLSSRLGCTPNAPKQKTACKRNCNTWRGHDVGDRTGIRKRAHGKRSRIRIAMRNQRALPKSKTLVQHKVKKPSRINASNDLSAYVSTPASMNSPLQSLSTS